MQSQPSYETLHAASRRANWRLDDAVGAGLRFDFARPFLPEALARTDAATFLSAPERLALNQIRAFGYLSMFELVETFIFPFIEGEAQRSEQVGARAAALAQFADEEEKHMALFRAFRAAFESSFGSPCGFIGPADEIRRFVLSHSPLGIAITVLGIEWMSQGHYVESVRDDRGIDPQFRELLRLHWMEEAQHARLDALVIRDLAARAEPSEIDNAIGDYFKIVAFIDGGLENQAALDLASLERRIGRRLPGGDRERLIRDQRDALDVPWIGDAKLSIP